MAKRRNVGPLPQRTSEATLLPSSAWNCLRRSLSAASAAVVIKNYSSISITGSGKLAFSTPTAAAPPLTKDTPADSIFTFSI